MPANEENQISPVALYSIMALMLIFGTCNTLVMKAQDNVVVGTWVDPADPDQKVQDKLFTHPYFQCANMFVGELMCLFVYFGKKACSSKSSTTDDETESNDVIPLSPGTQMAQKT